MPEKRTRPRRGDQPHLSTVRCGKGPRDRQPEAGAAALLPAARGVHPVEALEDPARLLRSRPGPASATSSTPSPSAVPTADPTGVPAGVCLTALPTRLADHLAQPGLVADHRRGATGAARAGERDRAGRSRGRCRSCRASAARVRRSIGASLQRAAPRPAGPGSAGPRPACPSGWPRSRSGASCGRLGAPAARPSGTARRSRGSPASGVRSSWRGVGDEAAHPRLRRRRGRAKAPRSGSSIPLSAARQPADLGARLGRSGHPVRQVAGGDRGGVPSIRRSGRSPARRRTSRATAEQHQDRRRR